MLPPFRAAISLSSPVPLFTGAGATERQNRPWLWYLFSTRRRNGFRIGLTTL